MVSIARSSAEVRAAEIKNSVFICIIQRKQEYTEIGWEARSIF
jgi:hypothetical protein